MWTTRVVRLRWSPFPPSAFPDQRPNVQSQEDACSQGYCSTKSCFKSIFRQTSFPSLHYRTARSSYGSVSPTNPPGLTPTEHKRISLISPWSQWSSGSQAGSIQNGQSNMSCVLSARTNNFLGKKKNTCNHISIYTTSKVGGTHWVWRSSNEVRDLIFYG